MLNALWSYLECLFEVQSHCMYIYIVCIYINQLTNGCRLLIGLFVVGGIIGCICCCYCAKKHLSFGTTSVQRVRAYDVATTNQPNQTVVPINQPFSGGFTTNAPPTYCETN